MRGQRRIDISKNSLVRGKGTVKQETKQSRHPGNPLHWKSLIHFIYLSKWNHVYRVTPAKNLGVIPFCLSQPTSPLPARLWALAHHASQVWSLLTVFPSSTRVYTASHPHMGNVSHLSAHLPAPALLLAQGENGLLQVKRSLCLCCSKPSSALSSPALSTLHSPL